MARISNLKEFLIEQIRELYDSEHQQLYFFTNVVKQLENIALQSLIQHHIKQTQEQIKRLKNMLNQLFLTTNGEHSEVMKEMINEANDLIDRSTSPKIKDVVIVSSIQYMKHFGIASYGSAYAYAEELGRRDIADQLYLSLSEEKEANNLLSDVALDEVNTKAKTLKFIL